MELEALVDTILFDALKRKPQKLSLDTNYSHPTRMGNISSSATSAAIISFI
jgi:hypothetical protein